MKQDRAFGEEINKLHKCLKERNGACEETKNGQFPPTNYHSNTAFQNVVA